MLRVIFHALSLNRYAIKCDMGVTLLAELYLAKLARNGSARNLYGRITGHCIALQCTAAVMFAPLPPPPKFSGKTPCLAKGSNKRDTFQRRQ